MNLISNSTVNIANFYSKRIGTLLLFLLSFTLTFSQATPQFYNDATAPGNANGFPLNSATNKVQWIYGPNLFNAGGTGVGSPAYSGNITKVYFMIASTATVTTYSDFTIKLAQNVGTSTTWTSTTFNSGMTTCFYQASFTTTGATTNTWYGVQLQTPFLYNPNLSLVFEMQVSAGTGNTMAQNGSTSQRIWGAYNNATGTGFGTGLVDFGFNLSANSYNDAGVLSIDSPGTFCGGVQNIKATIKNYGRNQVNPVTVNWSLNNVLQTPYTYNSLLDTIGTANNTAQIFLGSYSFPSFTTIKVWTSNPNNIADTANYNDTLSLLKSPALTGAYTINPSGSGPNNFTSFTSMASILNSSGVCGPIVITVAPGTYNEQISLGNIFGASATNTIMIDGVDTTNRILTSNTGSNPAVIQLNSSKYITIKNLTIVNTNTTQNTNGYYGIHITNAANYNNILGCKISVPIYGAGGALYPLAVGICGNTYSTAGDNGNYNTLDGNRMIGGYYGISVVGTSTAPSTSMGNKITNNKIEMAYYMGIYYNYGSNITIDHNTINNGPYYSNDYGIYAYYLNNSSVTRNTISASYYGLMFYTYPTYNTGSCTITNNMINSQGAGTTFYGLYINNANNTNISHNTVLNSKANGAAFYNFISYTGNRVNNNIFMVTQATPAAFYVANVSTTYYFSLDYNTIVSSVGNANLAYFGGIYYPTLASLKAANINFNQNNNGVLPIFESSTNLHLSIALEQARGVANVGVPIDIDSETRCTSAPSIGADESNYVPPALSAGFTSGTIYLNSPATLLNNYPASLPMNHKWYVNGNFVSSGVNLLYTFTSLGTHNVAIRSTNCSGTDSVTIVVTVVNPVNVPSSDFVASPSTVNNYQNVNLIDMSTNGPTSWIWSVSPGTMNVDYFYTLGTTSTSKNPVIYFSNAGLYDVCLTATNGVGSGNNKCKTNYITVKVAQSMCMAPFNTKLPVGNLFSSGGPSGGYGQNENCLFTIDACADSTFLNVTSASFGSATVDRLEIYEGNYAVGKTPVAQFIGGTTYNNLPQTIGVKGKMTLREITDATSNNGQGIVANWYTSAGTYAAPTGTILGSSNAYYCVSGLNNYYSSSFRDPSYTYEWDFDNDGLVDMLGMDGYFSFGALGSDTIKLKISGCGGIVTLKKFVDIIAPSAPVANFSTSTFVATRQDTFQMNDISDGGVTSWKWTITGPGAIIYVGGTTNTSRSPKVMSYTPGDYTVKLVVTNCAGTDSITKANFFRILTFCIPTAGYLLPDMSVSNFQLGTINNTVITPAPGTVAYRDFTQTAFTTVDKGASYQFSVKRAANNNMAGIKIWVDWNQDGTFDPVTELTNSTITGNLTWSSSLSIPKTAAIGATRLRIGVTFNTQNNTPCGANLFGEFQDFRLIVRNDATPPILTLGGTNPTYVEIGRNFVENGDFAIDAVDGLLTDSIYFTGYITGRGNQLPITKQATVIGNFGVDVSVSDFSGNTTTITREVIVSADTTKPVITLTGTNPFFVDVYTSFVDPGASALDFYYTTPLIVNATNNVDTAVLGNYSVTYTTTDVNGNNAVPVIRTVIVRDGVKPVVTFPTGTDTVYAEIGSNYIDAGAIVTDNYYSGLTATWTGSVNTFVPGTYYYTFTSTDGSGNISLPKVRVIIVRDGTAPTIILASPAAPDTMVIEVKMYTSVPEPGYTAIDNYYPKSMLTITKSGSVDLNKIGVYVVTYVASDPAGNNSLPKQRIYKVIDSTKPVITLNGTNTVNICRWRTYTELGAVVTDNYWTGLQITTSSNLDMNVPGTYIITYSAKDSSGNIANTEQRFVNVIDYTSSSCQAFSGISNPSANNRIQIVPNPAKDFINVEITFETKQASEIVILNSIGQVVKVINDVQFINNKMEIDLSNISAGIYFLTVNNVNGIFTQKFVINK